MSTACSTHWQEEQWVQSFGLKTLRPKHIWVLKILK